MKSLFTFAVALLLSFSVFASTAITYPVAHTRSRDTDMVIVKVGARFFEADLKQQERWYTDVQACVRSVKLRGTVIVVNSVDGRFRFYGPKSWHKFLGTIDMAWVNARLNKELSCTF